MDQQQEEMDRRAESMENSGNSSGINGNGNGNGSGKSSKKKILIVDDSDMNRYILTDMLEDNFDIREACDGMDALAILKKEINEISLVLLDIVMPRMDGFGVLKAMNENGWIKEVPVIVISAESGSSQVQKAYELGVTDFIPRPFDTIIVGTRVHNTLLLYEKQRRLEDLVGQQFYEKEQRSNLMIDILSHIVEFRNGESGLHILHVRTITGFFLKKIQEHTDKYHLTEEMVETITVASALHDIGKIAIDDRILNKPGRLTDEEFRIMKTHSEKGAQMLSKIPVHDDSGLVRAAHDIARWHHERWDGRGYPDGLKGDQIPISAQIVALADVYDALTSVRVYKGPYSHEEAVHMILDGQCGAFNPLLMECLKESEKELLQTLSEDRNEPFHQKELRSYESAVKKANTGGMSERTLRMLDYERMKYQFYAAMTDDIHFEYTLMPSMLTISAGAEHLGLGETIYEPAKDEKIQKLLGEGTWDELVQEVLKTTPANKNITYECQLNVNGVIRRHKIMLMSVWTDENPPKLQSVLGKAVDIHAAWMEKEALEQKATKDPLTGLLNRAAFEERMVSRMEEHQDGNFALLYFDLDDFKSANDNYGHLFGDRVLQELANRMEHSIRGSDIAARIGGDEFMLFLDCMGSPQIEPIVQRIHRSLCGDFEGFPITVSMGVAASQVVGTGYKALYDAADEALYVSKDRGKARYTIFTKDMVSVLGESKHSNDITPLDQ